MTSAIVEAYDVKNSPNKVRILLDTCATANFVTLRFAEKLQLPRSKCSFNIGALNNLSTTSNSTVKITFKSMYNDFKKVLDFLIVPNITNLVPTEKIPRERLKIPKGISLADPNFHIPAPVNMLVGAGVSLSLFQIGSINLSENSNDLYLQKTRLGWIIGGGLTFSKSLQTSKNSNCLLSDLETKIEKFWLVEELSNKSVFSQEELDCEAHFKEHVIRYPSGRFCVALPFKGSPSTLGDSKTNALKRLNGLRKKFENDIELKVQYTSVIHSYLTLDHMSPLNPPQESEGFYLPHHGVIKSSSNTTKLRVVYDASAKSSSGVSLNDILMVGPTIQDDLFTLLIRFRFYIYVLLADIEKMYRQFLIREEDRKYQKILWLENDEIKEFHLNTITFGLAPASFLAIRCLHKLAEDEAHNFPLAAKLLKEDFYVDNLMTGASTIAEAREIYNQMTGLLSKACLKLQQWASNEDEILANVDEKCLDNEFKLNKNCTLKTLGIFWKAKEDIFIYSIKNPEVHLKISKRIILSEIAKLFDPLGLLGPVILYAKLIMQELWVSKVTWDESVPSSIHYNWTIFCSQLDSINSISFTRNVLINNSRSIQLHGFCDASEKGYGACLYIRSDNGEGKCQASLLCSKSRVAPLKKISIPRMELCGALLLTNLYTKVINSLRLQVDHVTFWTDSEIVLHWLHSQSSSLKTFVSNRVSEIQSNTNVHQWRHVRSNDNPADKLSRGQLPNDFIKNKLWIGGPSWLVKDEKFWPEFKLQINKNSLLEKKRLICLDTNVEIDFLKKFSSFEKLKTIVALCYRFLPQYRHYKNDLKLNELRNAEIVILKLIQHSQFGKEIHSLKNTRTLHKESHLYKLDPFIDQNGLLRVGGRLKNSDISFEKQHAIILPKSNFVTDLIIISFHHVCLHAGSQTTLYNLRQKYWPIDGRNQIKKIIRKCVICFRAKPKLSDYKMGDLPSSRVTKTRPFNRVGIDYCGPFYIKERKFRNTKKIKIYVAIFVCMVVKAIHIETVSDLSTETFLGALKRFIARRGKPIAIYCDNATNFKGAKNELNELHVLLESKELKDKVSYFTNCNNIEFHFIPPSSPHFGGLWEAGVKSFKHHFKRVASNSLFTFEEFYTLSTEIESILNSRPLVPISSDINDISVLTPGHFLIGDSLISLPEPDLLTIPSNRLSSWQLISQVRQHFWKRWSLEYLNELNIRQKWNKGSMNPKLGMLVLLKEDNVPCMQWPMARIHQLHPGNDGVVRTVTLKIGDNLLKRPMKKIAILPINDQDNDK